MAATIVSFAGLRLNARARSSGAASSRVVARCESLPSQIRPPHLVLPLAPHATRDAPDADVSGPRLPSDLRGVTLRTQHVAPARLSRASLVTRAVATPAPVTVPEPEQREAISAPRPDVAMPNMQDPWNDPKWKDTKWTVYRDVAYDLQPFYDKHPGGEWLLNLAIGRDCTALIESYHLRPEVSTARFNTLPVLEDFPVTAVPRAPRPNDSPLYNSIRDRVRKELFPREGKMEHRMGGDGAAATIIGTAVACYAIYANFTGPIAGAMLGLSLIHI